MEKDRWEKIGYCSKCGELIHEMDKYYKDEWYGCPMCETLLLPEEIKPL